MQSIHLSVLKVSHPGTLEFQANWDGWSLTHLLPSSIPFSHIPFLESCHPLKL